MTEEDYVSIAAEEIQKEIDREIVDDMIALGLEKKGWTQVPIRLMDTVIKGAEWKINTSMWCHKNCQGDYKLLAHSWWFERAEDATAFILKWA